jgi:hypothetical protein
MGLDDSGTVVRFRAWAANTLFSALSRSTTTAHISDLMPSLRVHKAIPPLPPTCLWRGAWSRWGTTLKKVKHKLAPCHKYVWGSGDTAPALLTYPLDGSEWPASRPSSFISRDRGCDTHYIRGWTLWKEKISLLLPGIELRCLDIPAYIIVAKPIEQFQVITLHFLK